MARKNNTIKSVLFELPTFLEPDLFMQIPASGVSVGNRWRDHHLDEPANRPNGTEIETVQFTLPFTVNGVRGLVCPPGLITVFSKTGGGKSDLFRNLATVMEVNRVLAVEPADTIEELASLAMFNSADAGLLHLVLDLVAGRNHGLPVLDSIREPLFEINGPAGEKGVIMPFFTALTRISNALAKNGLTVFATVNPMNSNPDYLKQFVSNLSSAVPGYIAIDSRSTIGGAASFSGVVSFRPDRAERPFTFSASWTAKPDGVGAEVVTFTAGKDSQSSYILSQAERQAIADIEQSNV